jgi:hypothetical protein
MTLPEEGCIISLRMLLKPVLQKLVFPIFPVCGGHDRGTAPSSYASPRTTNPVAGSGLTEK